jgi:hypothetical protein
MSRLTQALIAYGALALAAWFLLTGTPRLIVGVVLLAFAAKTLLWHFKPGD